MDMTTFTGLILMLPLLGAGNVGFDLVEAVPAQEYFKVRKIEPTIETLLAFAGEPPTSSKKQIAQLFALRELADRSEAVKKSAKVGAIRELLQQIAQGKKANDSNGFAAEYARRALFGLDGGSEELPKVASWREGAVWIPGDVNIFVGADARADKAAGYRPVDWSPLFGMLSQDAKEHLFDAMDRLGNIRIDRVVVGAREMEKDKIEFFMRVTGKFNSQWLTDAYKGAPVEVRAGDGGPKVRVVRPIYGGGEGPAMALVGDTDFLLAGVESMAVRNLGTPGFVRVADAKSLERMLALVAKPGPNATDGRLKADFARLPQSATAAAVAHLLASTRFNNPVAPHKIVAHLQRSKRGIEVHMQATTDGDNHARKLVQLFAQWRDAKRSQVDKLKGQAAIPDANVNAILAMLESVQLRSEGNIMQMNLLASIDAIMSLPALAMKNYQR